MRVRIVSSADGIAMLRDSWVPLSLERVLDPPACALCTALLMHRCVHVVVPSRLACAPACMRQFSVLRASGSSVFVFLPCEPPHAGRPLQFASDLVFRLFHQPVCQPCRPVSTMTPGLPLFKNAWLR